MKIEHLKQQRHLQATKENMESLGSIWLISTFKIINELNI